MTRSFVAPALAALALAGCAPGLFAPAPQAAAVPVPAPAPAPPEERLIAAIEAEGCLLNAGNVDAVLRRANITQDDLVALTPRLAAEGRAEVSGAGSIRVLSPNC